MDLQTPANLPLQDVPASGSVPPVQPPPIQAMPPISSAPSSLPSAADDMFSGVDRNPPVPAPIPAPISQAAAAPQVVSRPMASVPSPVAPMSSSPSPLEPHHPPVLHYVLIALAVIVGLGLIASGVWFFAIRRPAQEVMETLPTVSTSTTSDFDTISPSDESLDEPIPGTQPLEEPEMIPSKPVVTPPEGTNIPPPTTIDPNAAPTPTPTDTGTVQPSTDTGMVAEPTTPPTVDEDSDALSDAREGELGTNFMVADTDGDGLNDGDEVLKYRTNPLVPDTDGDGFPDSVEIQKGYNPLGPGRCANPACTV
ncbi:hypothetical protein KBD34_01035 [Patescibacteria group bacterium]|nr:hypothetical protein [Patescibacteria group bacterium]